MTDASAHYRDVADAFDTRIGRVAAEQWELPTPCTEWAVRDLVGHVVGVHHMMLAGLDGVAPTGVPGTDTGSDELLAGWREATAKVTEALADPARAGAPMPGPFSGQAFAAVADGLLCADTLVHTWDLARATGQPERLDPTAVAQCMAFLTPMDEGMRGPGRFAARIDPPPGADEQTRLLNFCGRPC
jgi:uncharacterized protein (TIGR03086 family)